MGWTCPKKQNIAEVMRCHSQYYTKNNCDFHLGYSLRESSCHVMRQPCGEAHLAKNGGYANSHVRGQERGAPQLSLKMTAALANNVTADPDQNHLTELLHP